MGTFVNTHSGWVEPAGPSRLHVLIWSACSAILGLLLVLAPVASTLALVTVVGVCWLIGGIVSTIAAFWQRGDMWGWRAAGGIVSAFAGFFVFSYPLFSAFMAVDTLAIVLAVSTLVLGGVTLFSGHSFGTALLGLALLAVGVLMLIGAFHVLALVSLVQWIGLLFVAASLASGISAVVGGHTPARS
jgi:uncharacterized membrane protein HdeD (DUF308 family)